MPSLTLLLNKLSTDYPSVTFKPAEDFRWSPSERTIYYTSSKPDADALLIHELSHSILEHSSYDKDIELLAMERDAWNNAVSMASHYDVAINDQVVQDHLDTYRGWLHARSSCPNCASVGVQVTKDSYHCVACLDDWRVNEARICGLKRYKIKK